MTRLIGALVTGDNFHTLHCNQSCLASTALKMLKVQVQKAKTRFGAKLLTAVVMFMVISHFE